MNIKQEVQSLSPSALIELFVLDTTMFENGSVSYFHSGISQVEKPIVWQGVTYLPVPIQAEGFDISSQGTLPRPTVRIANVGGVLSSMAISMDDLIGAKVTRKRTFARYLDSENFPSGNPNANPDQFIPDELWFVDKKLVETRHQVEWELASAFDFDGVKLPFRQILKNSCPWRYRSSECGYTGGYVDANDNPTTDLNKDTCSKRLKSCGARFGKGVPLPFGGFPGAERGD